jgi:DNA-binding transcriptional MerR regulator
MLIGELAARAGVTPKAVRYYERRGLLKPERTKAHYRDFDERALAVVQTIRRGQNLGIQLDELREVVELIDHGSAPCQTVRSLLAEKRADVARRIKELRDFDKMLAKLEGAEGTDDPGECSILKRAEHAHAPPTGRRGRSR